MNRVAPMSGFENIVAKKSESSAQMYMMTIGLNVHCQS